MQSKKQFIKNNVKILTLEDREQICKILKINGYSNIIKNFDNHCYVDLDKIQNINIEEIYNFVNLKITKIKTDII